MQVSKKQGQCKRCGRTLTNPESIKAGYGKVCLRRIERAKATPPMSEIDELRKEIQQLKVQLHNLQLPQLRNSLPPMPSNGTHNITTIPIMDGGWNIGELKTNELFLKMQAIANAA